MKRFFSQSTLAQFRPSDARVSRFLGAGVVALAAMFGAATTVAAQNADDRTVSFVKGDACKDFALDVFISGSRQVSRQFYDAQSNLVRLFEAGRGFSLRFVNATSGASLNIKPNGSVSRTTIDPNTGAVTSINTGHNVLILQASDTGGPSVIQYVGRLVYTVAPNGVFTVEGFSGKQVDICAALSS